jgi:hypothetical protein
LQEHAESAFVRGTTLPENSTGNVGFVLLSFDHAQLAAAPWRHALALWLWLDSQMPKRVKRAPVDSLCRKAKPTEIRAFPAQPKGW